MNEPRGIRSALASVVAPLARDRRVFLPLALVLLFSFGFFVGSPRWNQNSRLALTRALVEHRTPIIDPYHETTGDKSYRDGHFYSDKAPGLSLLATVPYAVFYAIKGLTGGELPAVSVRPLDPLDTAAGRVPDAIDRQPGDRLLYNQAHRVALYLCNLATTSVLALLGLAALYLLTLRQLDGDRPGALLVSLAYGLATPALAYSTAFYGHQPCAAFLIIGFALAVLLPQDGPKRLGMTVGLSLGMAVLCEYPAAAAAIAIAAWAGFQRGPRFFAWLCVGALPCAVVLGIYHQIAFGGPLLTGYDFVYHEDFAEGMRVRYGIHSPSPQVLSAILFGSYRGLFYLAPILLLAGWGLAAQLGSRVRALPRGAIGVAAAVVAYYVLLSSSYYMWDGGAALGPRHLVPMLPFLALGLAPALRLVPRAWLVLGAISLVQMVVGASAGPEAPQYGNPVWEFAWPHLMSDDPSGSTNLGRLLGLRGVLSLLPLVALWVWGGSVAASLEAPPHGEPRGATVELRKQSDT